MTGVGAYPFKSSTYAVAFMKHCWRVKSRRWCQVSMFVILCYRQVLRRHCSFLKPFSLCCRCSWILEEVVVDEVRAAHSQRPRQRLVDAEPQHPFSSLGHISGKGMKTNFFFKRPVRTMRNATGAPVFPRFLHRADLHKPRTTHTKK